MIEDIYMYRTSTRPAPLDFLAPSAASAFDTQYPRDIQYSQALPPPPPAYLEAPVRDGLRTPPEDEMATAYQSQYQYGTYDSQKNSAYSTPAGTSTYTPTYHGPNVPSRAYSAAGLPPTAPNSGLRSDVYEQPYVRSQPTSPQRSTDNVVVTAESTSHKKTANESIRPNFRIPTTISKTGGNLPDFAAQITCLFWFESTATLEKAEQPLHASTLVKRLRDDAAPSLGFRKWVTAILSTTQVTDKVIILALLFIYRLKKINPAVKGKVGSEYRLLTVALMLGNKFLDDNTYTNKTWAEVSGIPVTEIHVMEVEFLSNMRYSLLASKEEWAEWHKSLANIKIYIEEAGRVQTSPVPPTHHRRDLPSPPISNHTSPPSSQQGYLPNSTSLPNSYQWPPARSTLPPLVSPLSAVPDYDQRSQPRKRSYEGESEEPVAKRVTRQAPGPVNFLPNIMPMRHDAPRLPVPNLSISTSQPTSNTYHHTPTSMSQNPPVLPPLNGRAMSIAYPTTPNTWTPQLPMLTPSGSHSVSSTPNRRHSPHSVQDLLAYAVSPISGNFPGHNHANVSPSVFLQQRSSPYKPIRHVDTLLYPPPSASMHEYSINTDSIHYQPLGKRNDYRSGVVPDYAHHYQQHRPVLPQPNFRS